MKESIIIIFGDPWKLLVKEGKEDDHKSMFDFKKKLIELSSIDKQGSLIHELFELVLAKNLYRFYGGEGAMEPIFVFDHSGLCRVVEQLVEILKQNNVKFEPCLNLKSSKKTTKTNSKKK